MSAALRKIIVVLTLLVFSLRSAVACSVCYGEPDSPMSRGLTWGILALCVVVGAVLTGVAAFFVHVGRRSRDLARAESGDDISS